MRKRVLIPMAIGTAALAAVLEVLAQRSKRKGGLSLARTADDIPDVAEFKYEFLPTIIAVILSIAWNWVDLDVKRIQPWLELSKEGGVSVQDSLNLDYPYDFVAWVPFKAAKRRYEQHSSPASFCHKFANWHPHRHWTVFVSGTVMVLIFWVITPLQGAIFGQGPVRLREPTTFYSSQDLLPVQDQSKATDTSILHHQYVIKYLNQTYPPFTTAQYALRPFKLDTDSKQPGAKNWTTTTTKFWTDLHCNPAQVSDSEFDGQLTFNNGKGCNASNIEAVPRTTIFHYHMHYLSWHNSAYATQYFQRKTCGEEFANNFLAITSRGRVEDKDHAVTALFCETSYWKQRVSVTVPDDTFHPDDASITPEGPVEELPATEFNSTGLEFLMGSSVSEVLDTQRDYWRNLIVDQYDRIKSLNVEFPLDPMVGFAIGGLERPLDDYLDPLVVEDTYRAVHQATFALAYHSLLTAETPPSEKKMEGSVEFVMHGVIVSRVFSAIVEGLLLAVGVCCILLMALGSRIKSNLSEDPATLGGQLSILRNSSDLLSAASGDVRFRPETSLLEAETTRLHLQCGCQSPDGATTITVAGLPEDYPDRSLRGTQDDEDTPVRPLALRRVSGSAFTVLLVAALAGLLALRFQEQKFGG